MKFLFSLIFSILFLSACSVYRSEGRKFLEKRAYEYSGVEAYREQCTTPAHTAGLTQIHSSNQAQVFALEPSAKSQSRIRVATPTAGQSPDGTFPYGCDYGFTDQQELTSKMAPAIEQTVDLLNSSGN
jgi:hypothetical protein